MFFLISAALLAMPLVAADDSGKTYKSTFIDQSGRLHILVASNRDILAPMQKEQVGFETPSLSPDGKTVGWLELYPFPRPDPADYDPGPIPGFLTLYRDGRILHRYGTVQVFWDWHFWRGGSEVAYSVGPTHGGATEVLLRDVTSGKVLARWIPTEADPPDWAKGLHY